MAFGDLTLRQLYDRELELTEILTNISSEIRAISKEPIEVQYTFEVEPRRTRKNKLTPPHRWTVKLKSPDDFEDAWDQVVQSFRRRFAQRKQWVSADGTEITPKQHRQNIANGIITDKVAFVQRWDTRQWESVLVGLQPSERDRRAIKQLTFADVEKIKEDKEEMRLARNEKARVQHEIRKRELAREFLSSWRARVMEGYGEDALRRASQKWLYARFGMKVADMDYIRRFRRGEIGIEDIYDKIASYQRID